MKSLMNQNNSFLQEIMKTILPYPSVTTPPVPLVQVIGPIEAIEIEERKLQLQMKQFEFDKLLELQRRDTATWEVNHLAHKTKSSPQELAVEKYHDRVVNLIEVHSESLMSNTKVNQGVKPAIE
jgi:hypothetical protein